jgi:hypothetical protein
MALIVRDTLGAEAVGNAEVEVVCVCAEASTAAAKKRTTRDRFFTVFSIWGRKISNPVYGAGYRVESKGQEGRGL